MKHSDIRTTNSFFKLITGACILTIECFIFFVMDGLILGMLFMLFFAYNTV